MNKALLLFFQIPFLLSVFAQQEIDTIQLERVEVKAHRLTKFGIGQQLITFDSQNIDLQTANSLNDLMAAKSSIFIKSYGAGSLASPASRGTGFGHTAVLWNGFNLQSPLNGGIDFSLLPLVATDEVLLQQGGTSALYGSGAIGGTIYLQQKAKIAKGWHGNLGINGGSFDRLGQGLKLSVGLKKWAADFRVQHDQAKNDFLIGEKKNRKRQTNAALNQWAFTQHNRFQLSTNQILNTWAWIQITDRQLPPGILQNNVHAQQKDTSIRMAAEWQRYGRQHIQKIRSAWLDERFEYVSDLEAPSLTRSKSFISEFENDWLLSKQQNILTGINWTQEIGVAPGIFGQDAKRNRLAAFLSYKQALAKWQSVLSLRQEWLANTSAPTTGSIGVKSPDWSGLVVAAQWSRNYKLPTFNDLYWAGKLAKGNPDLLAEKGWNGELNLSFKAPVKKHSWTNRLTAFNLLVDDWIIWIPQENNTWQPDNLRKVWSRGLEAFSQIELDFDPFRLSTSLNYQWNRATNEKVYAGAEEALGKQLIHVPIHSIRAQINLSYRQSRIIYRHQYNGVRFTSSDNQNDIAAYQLGEMILSHRFLWGKKSLNLQCRIENIWNADYEVLSFRPMPGRGIWGSLKFGF